MVFRSRLACALVLAGAALQAACASMCREMAADRAAFFRRRASSAQPHATVFIPFAVGDRLIARRLGAVKPVEVPIRAPGRVGALLDSLRLVLRRVTLQRAADDRLGLRVELDAVAGDTPLFAVTADVDVRPEVDAAKGSLHLGLQPRDVRRIRPSIDPYATAKLAAEIRKRLPSVARKAVSESMIETTARAAIDDVIFARFGELMVDSGLLSSLGEMTRLAVDIPVVPVSRISLRSLARRGGDGLLVGIHTTLPAAAGVPMAADPSGDTQAVQVRLSGDALAELGNRALATGRLPRRYDDKMRPKKDGDFTPGLRFVAGRRPFKIIAWRVKSPCLRARIGADPTVGLRGGALVVGFEHGEVEEVRGAMLVRARVWLKRLGADAIRFSKETLSSAQISIAGIPLTGTIERAFYRAGELGFDVAVE